jgi:hypothetical protein
VENNKVMEKIKNYLETIEYGKIILTIHQGQITYIEKQEKEKISV